jgi:hypothetical protein
MGSWSLQSLAWGTKINPLRLQCALREPSPVERSGEKIFVLRCFIISYIITVVVLPLWLSPPPSYPARFSFDSYHGFRTSPARRCPRIPGTSRPPGVSAHPSVLVLFLRRRLITTTRILTQHVNTAATLILVYDLILTFDIEVERIWENTPWSGAKVLWMGVSDPSSELATFITQPRLSLPQHRYLNLVNFLVIPMLADTGIVRPLRTDPQA